MDYRERFFAALKRKPVDRVPFVVPTQTAIVDFMKESGAFLPDAHTDPEKMAALALAAHKIGGVENVRVPFDICVEAEACGCEIKVWEQDSLPIAQPLIASADEVSKYQEVDPEKDGRMPVVIEAVKILKDKVGDKVPIIAGLSSPFQIVSILWDADTLFTDLYEDPEAIIALTDKTKLISHKYAKLLVEAGADALTIVDGNSQNLGPTFYGQISGNFVKEMIETISVPTILHLCGGVTPFLENMADGGTMGMSIDAPVDMETAKSQVGDRVALIGNVEISSLYFSSSDEVFEMGKSAIEKGVDILSPGCGFVPGTPLNNVKALARAAHEIPKPA